MVARPQQWTPRSIARRAREVLRSEGLSPLFFKTVGELGYRRVRMLARELELLEAGEFPPGVRYELLTSDRFDDFAAISQSCDEAEARRRLDAGQLCQIGYVDGEPASCCWLALAGQPVTISYLGIEATPSPGYGYVYELYVAPKHRGTGLSWAGFHDRVRILVKHGAQRAAALVMPENAAGLKHALGAGYRSVGHIHRIRFLGLSHCWTQCTIDPPPMRVIRQ